MPACTPCDASLTGVKRLLHWGTIQPEDTLVHADEPDAPAVLLSGVVSCS